MTYAFSIDIQKSQGGQANPNRFLYALPFTLADGKGNKVLQEDGKTYTSPCFPNISQIFGGGGFK